MFKLLKFFFIFTFFFPFSIAEARFWYWETGVGLTQNKWSKDTYNLPTTTSDIGTDLMAAVFLGLSQQGRYPNHQLGLGLRHRSLNFDTETIRLLNLRLIYRYETHRFLFDAELSPLNEFDQSGVKDFESFQVTLGAARVLRKTQFLHISLGPSIDLILPEPNKVFEFNYSLNLSFQFIPSSSASSNLGEYKRPRY